MMRRTFLKYYPFYGIVKRGIRAFTFVKPRIFSNIALKEAKKEELPIKTREFKRNIDFEPIFKEIINNIGQKALKKGINDLLISYITLLNLLLTEKSPFYLNEIKILHDFLVLNDKNLIITLKNSGKLHEIFTLYLKNLSKRETFEKKTQIIDFLSFFTDFTIKKLETEVYQHIYNKRIGFPYEEGLNIKEFREKIANSPIFTFFIESKVFPKGLPRLKPPILTKELKSLAEYNESLYNLLITPSTINENSRSFNDNLNKSLLNSFPLLLEHTPLKTLVFFMFLASRKESPLKKNNFLIFQVFEKVLLKIENLPQFLSIFSILDFSFQNIDRLVPFFYKYALMEKYTLNSLQILQFIKITKTFYDLSHENHEIFALISIIDDILKRSSKNLSLNEKFHAVSLLKSLDIPSKIALNSEILANLDKCPKELFPRILVHFSDFSYNLVDFHHLERILIENLKIYTIYEKITCFLAFIYHLKGSFAFIETMLEACLSELKIEDIDKNTVKKPSFGLLCSFYQIIFTIKHFYKEKPFSLIKLDNFYRDFKVKYDQYDQPFYPKTLPFSKEEFSLESTLKAMEVDFVKEKKVLLHKVDFFIEERLCLELQGRHHFASKSLFDGKTLWKARNIKELSGFSYKTISIEKWMKSNEEKRREIIRDLMK